MAPRLIITGSTGYIGARLVAMARERGFDVVELGRRRGAAWRIGDEPAASDLEGAVGLVHLAHSWATSLEAAEEENVNISGTLKLAEAAKAAGVPRFVFASSTSSRREALNVYGRTKFRIEEHLVASKAAPIVRIARIGLVYGGPRTAMYGLMAKLAALSPILPMIGLSRKVQPIHLDEVAAGLLALATGEDQPLQTFVLAQEKPISFAAWLRILRRGQGKGKLHFIPVPLTAALLACRMTKLLPLIPTVDPERVLGLAGAAPMESGESLRLLKLNLSDPATTLAGEFGQTNEEQSRREAQALLQYLGIEPTEIPLQRLCEGLRHEGLSPLGLSPAMIRHPGLLALFEPPANRTRHRLAQALYLADLASEPERRPGKKAGFFGAILAISSDVLLFPLRALLAGRYR
ncbi:sugar nucleotide-binding protein [Rhizobium leguminosarum bv. viciae]|uniref:NAD-dependent epimerase/dehydratase family protein n=1 Tax=Rhizobium ruizarguesonis TaxID=2081791 RepID=UPI00143F104A|nr:NAD(P)-dependent oxidoreductase [Rhizobium ruizarguesonis]MBC2807384.1 NAD(P)-dependent oxidoreductase [Rhizobium ruizarguesonis]NKJ74816.1 sugar nucleotide-binding protein [Rhizobium leguminosarum bv. viciae]NKQ74690.1 NAD(P)-dependent oxidoreductase [Rhizobium ruizarguesonis]NKQ81725.1 NAD(P)-dependent oxidoreductase [Rhizobium ruizarguesonis]